MRVALVGVVLAILFVGWAEAAPKPKVATKAQTEELAKLDKELSEAQTKQRYYVAAKVARKLFTLQRAATGDDSIETERRKQMLASMLNVAGDYAGAQTLYMEMLRTAEKKHGPESREVLYALYPINGTLWGQTNYEALEPIMQRMLAIVKKIHGEKSSEYAQQLTMYGTLLNVRNEYSSAIRAYEQSFSIQESLAKDKNDPALLSPLQMLASVYWQTNQKPKAIQLYDRAIAISQAGADVTMKASTLYGVASVYHYGGRDDLAQPLIKRAIEIFDKEIARLEKDDPDGYQLPGLLGQLGFIHRQSGDLVAAEKAFAKAVALGEKRMGFSGWESSLADIRRAQGKPKEALALLEKVSIATAKVSEASATAYNTSIAEVLIDLKDFDRAEKLLDEHRTKAAKTYGKRHPIYAFSLLTANRVYVGKGKIDKAEKALDEALDIAERELQNALRTGTEADHVVYFARNAYLLDTAINFQLNHAAKSTSAARLGLTTLLRRKGRVLDAATAAMATIRAKLSPDDKKLLDELASARAQLAKLTVAGPAATGEDEYAKAIAELEDKIVRLEIQVGKKSAAYRVVSQPIELPAIQRAIPKDGRLVEIVNYQPYDAKAAYSVKPKLPPRRYGAFVVGAKADPVLVDLGDASVIDQAIEKFRKAVADPDNDAVADLGRALYDLTMAKIIPKLGGSKNILIAPDGALNVVPFSALVDDKGKFLIKDYLFTYVTSGRDLLRLGVRTKAKGGGLIVADPKFDASTPAKGGGTRGRRSADFSSLIWNALPGTGQEADAILKTMRGFKILRGKDATENALKQVAAPQVLHLATHGFFLPDEKPAAATDDRGGGGAMQAPGGGQKNETAAENPLLRSGLVLAGANKLSSGDEDGILTAMEASGLDLWGTKLVVLSACETGIGKVTNGEGVYGLRRALVIAGAESLVMTLWQVDDFATKELMSNYYTKLQAGKPRSSALRDIQLELQAKPKYAHPYYWASFVPAGANTPLKD